MKALEASTNTHQTKSKINVIAEFDSAIQMQALEGNVIVTHGEHETIATRIGNRDIIKITQQEWNPILQIMQNSAD